MPRSAQDHSNGSSEAQSNPTVGQAVASYVASLAPEERLSTGQDLNAFTRWFGAQKKLRSITPPDLERYQEQLASESRTDTGNRLEALRSFLSDAWRQRLTGSNLAVEIKLKRKKTPVQAKPTTSREVPNQETVRLSREGYEKLSKELEYLETEMRPQIALELRTAAADKDFRENAPYDVAKQHQGEVEARIRELRNTLETAEVVDTSRPNRSKNIDLGSKVTLRDLLEDEEIVYTLVGPGEIDPRRGKISIQSPVGKALSGRAVGDEVEVEVPAGTLHLRIEKVDH